MSSLITNAFDMHVHSSPDVLKRKFDDLELAQRFTDAGMSGFCLKSHYFCTSERAELVRKVYPNCNAVGAICLNSTVGGLNAAAVELAAMSGARVVWLPTCDSKSERDEIFDENGDVKPGKKPPFWANIVLSLRDANIDCPRITLLDENGKLVPAMYDVLDTVAKRDLILATGHASHDECFAVAKAAKERGVKRLVITHATFPTTFYTVEEQKELIKLGAYIEHCYTTYSTGKCDFNVIAEQIKAVGHERVVLGTDLGQPSNVYADEGLLAFSQSLVDYGFSEQQVMYMNGDLPRMLINP